MRPSSSPTATPVRCCARGWAAAWWKAGCGAAAEGHLAGARHDGYRDRFGLDVERRLLLARDGKLLIGEDALIAAEPGRAKAGAAAAFAIRFHLHPDVEAIATQGGDRVLLRLGPDRAWAFALDAVEGVEDVALAIEDSLHLGADGPERTRQIVVTGRRAGDATRCRWQLGRVEG